MGPRNREGKGSSNDNTAATTRRLQLIDSDCGQTNNRPDAPPFDVPPNMITDPGPDGADTHDEALRVAQQAVWQNSRRLVNELADAAAGNYLAVRFLFEFAGLTPPEERKESKADFKSFMQKLLDRAKTDPAKQTSDAKVNLSTSGSADTCRS